MHALITALDTVFAPWITLAVVSLVLVFVCGAVLKTIEWLWKVFRPPV